MQTAAFYEACDAYGVLVWVEFWITGKSLSVRLLCLLCDVRYLLDTCYAESGTL